MKKGEENDELGGYYVRDAWRAPNAYTFCQLTVRLRLAKEK
jgi:hypothetical protein